jgi:hypothetical protein
MSNLRQKEANYTGRVKKLIVRQAKTCQPRLFSLQLFDITPFPFKG